MTKLPVMTARDVAAILAGAGLVLVRQAGRRIWRSGERTVPVPTHPGELKMGG
jgi:predicted RNA binding protein YcfA (HicA-like mRNA interferase family)